MENAGGKIQLVEQCLRSRGDVDRFTGRSACPKRLGLRAGRFGPRFRTFDVNKFLMGRLTKQRNEVSHRGE